MGRVSIFVAAFAALFALDASAEPVKLRIQWANVVSHITPLIPEVPRDIYRHYGRSYTVEPMFIAGSGPALTAIAAGEADLGGLGAQTLVLAVVEAKLDMRVVGQQASHGVDGYVDNGYWVRRTEIAKPEDLRGKTFAVNARGGSIDAAAIAYLARFGLQPAKDYQLVELRFPAMLPALQSKKVDATYLTQPFSLTAEKNPEFKQLFTVGDVFGGQETLSFSGKTDWIAKNRAVLVDFLEDNMRLRRWMYDPATRGEAIRILARIAKQPVEQFADWVYTKKDAYRHPGALVNVERFQRNVDDLHKAGVSPARIEAARFIDNSLAEEAGRRINEPR